MDLLLWCRSEHAHDLILDVRVRHRPILGNGLWVLLLARCALGCLA
jgi:hypothetical protein